MTPEIKSLEKLKHRWEMPLIWISIIVTILSVALGITILTLDESVLTKLFDDGAEDVLEYAQFAVSVLIFPFAIFFYRFYMAARAKSNAIRVGPNQLPNIWSIYQELGKKFEMKSLPKLYVTNGNGVVNAYALSCNTRHKYVVIHSEIALLAKQFPAAVEFVLAHELAHHKLGHVSLWRFAIGIIPNILIPLGISTTRAQEYSADRVALTVCGHHQSAMNLLAIGPWMHDEINSEEWIKQCEEEHDEIYVRIANLLSNHAVLVKRSKALEDLKNKGFDSHGSMF